MVKPWDGMVISGMNSGVVTLLLPVFEYIYLECVGVYEYEINKYLEFCPFF